MKQEPENPSAQSVNFVAYITLRNGKRIYASQYGKKAFPIVSARKTQKVG